MVYNLTIFFYDEIYETALEAGSGGIRWNSTTDFIQIMDENKNWIDYDYFDPEDKIIGEQSYILKAGTANLHSAVNFTSTVTLARNAEFTFFGYSDHSIPLAL